ITAAAGASSTNHHVLRANRFSDILKRKDAQRELHRLFQRIRNDNAVMSLPGAHVNLLMAVLIAMGGPAAADQLFSGMKTSATLRERREVEGTMSCSEASRGIGPYVEALLKRGDENGSHGGDGLQFFMPELVLELLPESISFMSSPGLRRVFEALVREADIAAIGSSASTTTSNTSTGSSNNSGTNSLDNQVHAQGAGSR
ncbi:unnamed protein product, partial [Ectocarpus fasciculatus]